MTDAAVEPASFRDPSGYVFHRDGVLYRAIQPHGAADWEAFTSGDLYPSLAAAGLIVEHEPADTSLAPLPGAVAVIRPRALRAISYPYEWSFSQLREAALFTLELQARALKAGMWLRDASAYNVQFDRGRSILIDSLSFEPADVTRPWGAYRQFCRHFLAPLALMAHRDVRLGLLLRDFIDGLPLDLASTLLPGRTRLNAGMLAHLHAHASVERRINEQSMPTATSPSAGGERRMTALRHDALLDSLRRTVEGLRWEPSGRWVSYGLQTSYTERGAASKRAIVERLLGLAGGEVVWDIGANIGTYSDLAAGPNRLVLAFDADAGSVERHWLSLDAERRTSVLPLVMDLTNPSPALGWAEEERRSFLQRGPADVVMALALVHHLAIGANVPLPRLASLLARAGRQLIVEFVPKEDPMTQRLLAARHDIFPDYTPDGFVASFASTFRVRETVAVDDSLRTLYLMERRDG